MAQKKSYSRYFIILQEDETGYSLASDKLPSGYTKLETKNDKCKVSFYVQNLKKEKEPYYMVLICNKKDAKKLVKLGMLNIDDYGRAEITYEFGAENIADSKISVDLIGGAAIVRTEESKIISVMSGFTSTEPPKDWRSYSLFEENIDELRQQTEPEIEVQEENVQQVEPRDVESSEKQKEEKNIFDEYEQKIEKLKMENEAESEKYESGEDKREEVTNSEEALKEEEKDVKDTENIEQLENLANDSRHHDKKDCKDKDKDKDEDKDEDEDEDKCKDKCKDKESKKSECDNNKDYPTGTVGEFFKLIAEDLDEIKDICTEIKRCRWYKVSAENLDGMGVNSNYNKYTIVFYPMINYYHYIKKQGHYILGYKYDTKGKMKYLVYGIPGTKKRCDQPYGGKSGFVTWVPVKEGDENEDSFGYWLKFYDFRTSTIVIPVK